VQVYIPTRTAIVSLEFFRSAFRTSLHLLTCVVGARPGADAVEELRSSRLGPFIHQEHARPGRKSVGTCTASIAQEKHHDHKQRIFTTMT
jgi:hypothetical protein